MKVLNLSNMVERGGFRGGFGSGERNSEFFFIFSDFANSPFIVVHVSSSEVILM